MSLAGQPAELTRGPQHPVPLLRVDLAEEGIPLLRCWVSSFFDLRLLNDPNHQRLPFPSCHAAVSHHDNLALPTEPSLWTAKCTELLSCQKEKHFFSCCTENALRPSFISSFVVNRGLYTTAYVLCVTMCPMKTGSSFHLPKFSC